MYLCLKGRKLKDVRLRIRPQDSFVRGNRDSVADVSLLVSFSCSRSLLCARPADMSACGCRFLAMIEPESRPRHSFALPTRAYRNLNDCGRGIADFQQCAASLLASFISAKRTHSTSIITTMRIHVTAFICCPVFPLQRFVAKHHDSPALFFHKTIILKGNSFTHKICALMS
jgi:hypothetical protein